MPKTKQQKQEILKNLQDNIGKQTAMVFVDYKGLGVGDLTALREQLRQVGSRLVVAKKTLFQKAFKAKGIDHDIKGMEGQIGMIFAFEEPIASLKAANTAARANENLKILGGYFEHELQSAANIMVLASLPSREELLAALLGTMTTPISGFASVLQGNIKGLVYVLAQKAKM